MELVAEELALVQIFRENAAERRREMRLREEDQRLRDEQKLRLDRKKEAEKEEKQFEEVMLASTEQIAAFNAKLDDYDTATVKALMDNQRALDDVIGRREQMEASAYRLPDGRMAFKSEDGARVYDRKGAELSRDTIHPEAIPDALPRWEAIKRNQEKETKLLRERQELHAFQERLDETRETASKGNVSSDTLAKMDADLKRAMPDSIKAELSGQFPGAGAEIRARSLLERAGSGLPDLLPRPPAP